MSSMVDTLPRKLGCVESMSATAPATCGVAIDVPLKVAYVETVVRYADLVLVPGAAMSGFCRLLPSTVTGPRLLKEAIVGGLDPVLRAPTVKTSGKNDGGSETVEQLGPEFPAATTVTMPAARFA